LQFVTERDVIDRARPVEVRVINGVAGLFGNVYAQSIERIQSGNFLRPFKGKSAVEN
jgi:hypothetical protein